MSGLRIGLLVDAGAQTRLVRDLVALSRGSGHYTIERLVVQPPAGAAANGRAARTVLGLLSRLERIPARLASGRDVRRERHAPERLGIAVHELRPAHAGGDGTDVEELRDARLDLLLHLGGPLPEAAVLGAARLGVVSLRHGGPGSDDPPGFREVRERRPSTEFAIVRLAAGAVECDVLLRGAIDTAPFYTLNADRLLAKSAVFLHRFLEDAASRGALPPAIGTRPAPARSRPAPSLRDQARYAARAAGHFLERASRRVLGMRWRWRVAYQFVDAVEHADLSRARTIPNPPHRYYADPCVIRREGRTVCFVEDYDCRTSKARITAIGIDDSGHRELGVALEEPFHLSFPWVFEADGELYMCPESGAAREIRLYRCVEFPLVWTLHCVLMHDVDAVDTVIAFHDGRWWLLTSIDSAGMGEYRSELHVFHAGAFDAAAWQPLPGNPVILDSGRARNGGLYVADGALHRVYQTHGFDVYGQSMGVARITELTPERYAETPVTTFAPDFRKGVEGTHTLSFHSGVLVFDYVRRERCG
jgi:hypothetical protein